MFPRLTFIIMNKKYSLCSLDCILSVLILGAVSFFAWRVTARFDYDWNWSSIPQFFFYNSPDKGWQPNVLINGLLTTIRLSVWTMIFSVLVGFSAGMMSVSRSLLARMLARTYVETVRNLPPLVLVFIFYFFIYSLISPIIGLDDAINKMPVWLSDIVTILCDSPSKLPGFISGVITLTVYEGAYIAEIVRGGIESVDHGQWEAAASLGFPNRGQLQFVIMPQAFKVIIPPLAGQFISIIKDSAIVSVISVSELTFQGLELMAATGLTFEVWITITVLYFLLTVSCAFVSGYIERKISWMS